MIQFENAATYGWEAAIRGMRNPMNSWGLSDSEFIDDFTSGHNIMNESINRVYEGNFPGQVILGEVDLELMKKLAKAGSEHSKYRRMINVTVDITAPLYWWKEFDTYKVGTVANSCSTMHKIHAKEFELNDFSHDHLCAMSKKYIEEIVDVLNFFRAVYISFDEKSSDLSWFKSFVEDYGLRTKKDIWWQMIQLLPSSYNQKRTIQLNYEVLAHIYQQRKNHKLDEWHGFCRWMADLPYAPMLIFMEG